MWCEKSYFLQNFLAFTLSGGYRCGVSENPWFLFVNLPCGKWCDTDAWFVMKMYSKPHESCNCNLCHEHDKLLSFYADPVQAWKYKAMVWCLSLSVHLSVCLSWTDMDRLSIHSVCLSRLCFLMLMCMCNVDALFKFVINELLLCW